MTRYVEASGPNWRRYNDGAFAYWQTDPETGKTVSTYYCNGKGSAFYKNLKEGYEFYENLNTGERRYKSLPPKKNAGEDRREASVSTVRSVTIQTERSVTVGTQTDEDGFINWLEALMEELFASPPPEQEFLEESDPPF